MANGRKGRRGEEDYTKLRCVPVTQHPMLGETDKKERPGYHTSPPSHTLQEEEDREPPWRDSAQASEGFPSYSRDLELESCYVCLNCPGGTGLEFQLPGKLRPKGQRFRPLPEQAGETMAERVHAKNTDNNLLSWTCVCTVGRHKCHGSHVESEDSSEGRRLFFHLPVHFRE